MSAILDNIIPRESPVSYAVFIDLMLPMTVLPPSLLGKWQLLVATTAVFNTVQNFMTLKLTRRIYNNVPSASGTRHFSTRREDRSSFTSDRPPSSYLWCLDPDLGSRAILCRVPHPRESVRSDLGNLHSKNPMADEHFRI